MLSQSRLFRFRRSYMRVSSRWSAIAISNALEVSPSPIRLKSRPYWLYLLASVLYCYAVLSKRFLLSYSSVLLRFLCMFVL